ncbi:MAG: hypothetical protein ACRDZR_01165 [Acidimicrobiales bacterium]
MNAPTQSRDRDSVREELATIRLELEELLAQVDGLIERQRRKEGGGG